MERFTFSSKWLSVSTSKIRNGMRAVSNVRGCKDLTATMVFAGSVTPFAPVRLLQTEKRKGYNGLIDHLTPEPTLLLARSTPAACPLSVQTHNRS
jgi:hypothetical protein